MYFLATEGGGSYNSIKETARLFPEGILLHGLPLLGTEIRVIGRVHRFDELVDS